MPRRFNVTGSCNPKLHYMVDIRGRLKKIRELIDNGSYFTINRASHHIGGSWRLSEERLYGCFPGLSDAWQC